MNAHDYRMLYRIEIREHSAELIVHQDQRLSAAENDFLDFFMLTQELDRGFPVTLLKRIFHGVLFECPQGFITELAVTEADIREANDDAIVILALRDGRDHL